MSLPDAISGAGPTFLGLRNPQPTRKCTSEGKKATIGTLSVTFQLDTYVYIYIYMGFSKNSGTPKWMVYKGKPY